MAKSRECVTTNGRAVFYACMWNDFRQAALDLGWALALHGSLKEDMDIMAMPWVEDAKPIEEVIKALCDCFDGKLFREQAMKPHFTKPHGRVVYTISIFSDFYLDVSVMSGHLPIKMPIEKEKDA